MLLNGLAVSSGWRPTAQQPMASNGWRLTAPRFPADGVVIAASRRGSVIHTTSCALLPFSRAVPCQPRAKRRAMHFAASDYGNKLPSCIP